MIISAIYYVKGKGKTMGKKFLKNIVGAFCFIIGIIEIVAGFNNMAIITILTGLFFAIGGLMFVMQARRNK